MLARKECCDRYRTGFWVLWLLAWSQVAFAAGVRFDVRKYGADGDGVARIRRPSTEPWRPCDCRRGRSASHRAYSRHHHLKSHVTLPMEPGARLVGRETRT
jgi:hypothetical protein